jgi:predicted permease
MENLFTVFLGSLVSLIICMLVGFVCRKVNVVGDAEVSGLVSLLVKITLPCTIFSSMMREFSMTLLKESAATFFLTSAAYLLGGLICFFIIKFVKPAAGERPVYYFSLIFANVGYMGFPVIQAVFGADGMIYASMANASFNLLAFTLGIKLFSPETGKTRGNDGIISASPENGRAMRAPAKGSRIARGKNRRFSDGFYRLVYNPALIATLLGLIFFVAGLRLPKPVGDSAAMIGSMTSPLSMMIVGAILAKNPLRSMFGDIKTLPVIFARLLVVPVITFFAVRTFVGNPVMLGVIVVLSAMPAAALTSIFAEAYKGDAALASRIVAASTLLSVITVPTLALVFGIV